jgi:hypothetical protein
LVVIVIEDDTDPDATLQVKVNVRTDAAGREYGGITRLAVISEKGWAGAEKDINVSDNETIGKEMTGSSTLHTAEPEAPTRISATIFNFCNEGLRRTSLKDRSEIKGASGGNTVTSTEVDEYRLGSLMAVAVTSTLLTLNIVVLAVEIVASAPSVVMLKEQVGLK